MAYFDNAATTLIKPRVVLDAVDEAMRELNVNYGRGQHALASKAYSLVEETRELVQEVGGGHSKQVVFTPTATESLNVLIRGACIRRIDGSFSPLTRGDFIYISPFEHNAVSRTLEFLKERRGIEVEVLDFDRFEKQFTMKPPAMIVMTHASNVTGEVLPIKEIFMLAKKMNPDCTTILDMAQTFGKECGGNVANLEIIDAVVFSGHKSLYAPFGASGMLISQGLQIEPLIFGGTGFDSENQGMPSQIPERFEVGSVNVPALAGLNAACKWRIGGREEIIEREKANYLRLCEVLEGAELEVVSAARVANSGVVSVLPPNGVSVDKFGQKLSEKNIQVRTGLHCAPLAHQTLGTFPAGTVRFSSSYFTSDEDFEILEKGLREVM